MSSTLERLALTLLRVWKPGPHSSWSDSAFVSVTDFRIARWRDLPSAWLEGIRLRRTWPQRQGAVGLWLWALPWARRSGSVSVWRTEEDLRQFVGWARHVQTMKRFRHAGHLTSASWTITAFQRSEVWQEAARRLAGQDPELVHLARPSRGDAPPGGRL
jgi:hypothetical protein